MNQHLSDLAMGQIEELHKPIISNFEKRKVYSSFKGNIWGADLADKQLISKYNKFIFDDVSLVLIALSFGCSFKR